MENDKTMFYIVAIIAVVAVFGMVFMAISGNKTTRVVTTTGSELTATDNAGQAITAASKTVVPTEPGVSKTDNFYAKYLSSQSLYVTLDAHVGSLGGSNVVYVCANNNGDLYKSTTPCNADITGNTVYGTSVSSQSLYVTADAHIGSLGGNSVAYVCVNANGDLFKSTTACSNIATTAN